MRTLLCLVTMSLAGCAAPVRVRVLHIEAPRITAPEAAAPEPAAPSHDDARAVPRIGAPGGSGAGSRRVVPAQSGNDTVGGLPAGIGGGSGPAGRG
jgi:hypothetical protein